MTAIIIIILLFGISVYYFQNKSGLLDRNIELLDKLNVDTEPYAVKNIYCDFKTLGAFSSICFNAYFYDDSIILIESTDFDLNQLSEQYADTYLITKKLNTNYPAKLFRNIVEPNQYKIDRDGNIEVSGTVTSKNIFIGKDQFFGTYPIKIKIRSKVKSQDIKDWETKYINWC